MITAVGVAFRKAGKVYWFDPQGLELKQGDAVVTETAGGLELGKVKVAISEIDEEGMALPLKPVLRLASTDDLRRENENRFREQQAYHTAQEKIKQHNLPMKLISAECTFDRTRMVFHFAAENRVDFRELAKDLARALRLRVELHQIGVRDEAKLLGGLGPCGRELCCAGFLTDFEPVGIKMAKEQDLSLNPQKISGVCGRLMCCLAYEFPCYKEAKQHLPKLGAKINTPKGPGRVSELNVPRNEIVIELEEGGRLRMSAAELDKCSFCPRSENHVQETSDTNEHEQDEELKKLIEE
jgi:cell fate regulator YaaT (PSP1 superfamily)